MKKSDAAIQCFSSGFNCAQAVFSTKEKQLFSTLCPKFVRDSSEIIEELLEVSE